MADFIDSIRDIRGTDTFNVLNSPEAVAGNPEAAFEPVDRNRGGILQRIRDISAHTTNINTDVTDKHTDITNKHADVIEKHSAVISEASKTAAFKEEAEVAANKALLWATSNLVVEDGKYSAMMYSKLSETSSNSAALASDNAATAMEASAVASSKASEWAEKATDEEVESGKYSARHHAVKAANSATTAADKADIASGKATDANESATLASDWAEKPEDEEVISGKYSAKHHATKAKDSESAAKVSEDNAKTSENMAEKWAETAKDTEVTTGNYSAKHYALYAEDHMNDAKTYRDRALDYSDAANTAKNDTADIKDATQAIADSVHGLKAKANTLVAGSNADVSYDSDNNELTLGIPKGDKGDKGDPFNIDAVGTFDARSDYDDQDVGYAFLSTNGYGPQPDECASTNFDGTLDIDADTTLSWDGDDLPTEEYVIALHVTDLTAGSIVLKDADRVISTISANGDYSATYTVASNDFKFVTDTDYDGNIDISIKRNLSKDSCVFFKASDSSGDWTIGSPFGKGDIGEAGNGIVSITRTDGDGSLGTTDTYTVMYTNGTSDTFTVANGNEYTDADAINAIKDAEISITDKTIAGLTNYVEANVIHVKVKASNDISKNHVVKITGFNASENAVEAVETDSKSDVAVGIVTSDIASGDTGEMLVMGMIQNVDTSSYSAGDVVYSAGSGGFTSTKPETYHQAIGTVLKSDDTNGVIAINCKTQSRTLDNADNTSDADKPVSTAQQSALDDKVNTVDIIDVLTDNSTDKPLSAKQGSILQNNIMDIRVIEGASSLSRFDKRLASTDVIEMKYNDDGALIQVRYDKDGDTESPYYRDTLEYDDDGALTSVKHYYNTDTLDNASGTTTMGYDSGNLISTSYSE